MNMKNEEKIYQLNTYNIAEYTSTDYTDNDIDILGDIKNLLFNKYFKLNANIYVVCVKGRDVYKRQTFSLPFMKRSARRLVANR